MNYSKSSKRESAMNYSKSSKRERAMKYSKSSKRASCWILSRNEQDGVAAGAERESASSSLMMMERYIPKEERDRHKSMQK